jgi:hypothetical protein
MTLLSPWVKRSGREAQYIYVVPRVRKLISIHPFHPTSSWRSAYLVKHRDNFTVFFLTGHVDCVRIGTYLCWISI